MPKLKFYMEWFNAWVGFYADVEKYRIYFQPIPCFGDKATGARINFMAGKNNWILLSFYFHVIVSGRKQKNPAYGNS